MLSSGLTRPKMARAKINPHRKVVSCQIIPRYLLCPFVLHYDQRVRPYRSRGFGRKDNARQRALGVRREWPHEAARRQHLQLQDRRIRAPVPLGAAGRGVGMIDHLVFLVAREDASPEDIEDLISSIRGLKDTVPGVVDLTVGENFSERSGGYTHGLFVRFESVEDLQEYLKHPDHLAVVEKLDRLTDRLVVDYEF